MFFDHLVLVTKGVCIPESHKAMAIRERVLDKLLFSGHCTDSRLKYTLSSSMQETYWLVLELYPEGRFQVWHMLGLHFHIWMCFQGM